MSITRTVYFPSQNLRTIAKIFSSSSTFAVIYGSKAKIILPLQNPTDLIGAVDFGIKMCDARFLFYVLFCSFAGSG
jgi:hypothetical protein